MVATTPPPAMLVTHSVRLIDPGNNNNNNNNTTGTSSSSSPRIIVVGGSASAPLEIEPVDTWSASIGTPSISSGGSNAGGDSASLFATGLGHAVDVLEHECGWNASASVAVAGGWSIRVSGPELAELGTNVLMTASTVFVLRTTDAETENATAVGFDHYWSPLSLERYRALEIGDTDRLAVLNAVSSHDVLIRASVDADFGIGDSDCSFVEYAEETGAGDRFYSATTVLLHELIHGMGLNTFLRLSSVGGTSGFVSASDVHLRYSADGSRVAPVTEDASDIPSLQTVAGQGSAVLSDVPMYNPSTASTGSSLSHLASDGVMGAAIGHSTCSYDLSANLLRVLRTVGWTSCVGGAGQYEWAGDPQLLDGPGEVATSDSAALSDSTARILWIVAAVLTGLALVLLAAWFCRCRNGSAQPPVRAAPAGSKTWFPYGRAPAAEVLPMNLVGRSALV